MASEVTPVVYGTFMEEIKNRFLCRVRVGDEDVICYVPSSCRLSNFVSMEGRTVVLHPIRTKTARTKFSVYAIKVRNKYVLTYLSDANKIIADNLRRRYFSKIGYREEHQREVTIAGYKCDLYIPKTRRIIEIKSILAFTKTACFPSVYSERALNQLFTLEQLLNAGYKVTYIFVSLNPSVKSLRINQDIPSFADRFSACIAKGMQVMGITIDLVDMKPVIHHSIPIEL